LRHIQILRAVELIARMGSIRKAAEKLHIVSSALTRQVQELERELGEPVFERKARGVVLTAAGEIFVRYSRGAIHELDLVRSQIEDLRGLRGGTVVVSAIEAVATTILPQAIIGFRKRNPRVRFEVSILGGEQVVQSVVADEAQIGITFNPAPHVDFEPIAEIPQELCAVMAAGHPLAGRAGLRLRDCQAYPLVLGDGSLGGRVLLERFLARASIRLEPVLVSNSVEMMKTLARLSDAICFQIGAGLGVVGGDKGLRVLPLADPGLRSGKLMLGTRRGRLLPVAAAVFCEQLRVALGGGRAGGG
jgi:DNA-binding transcriptional LysR family regulator